MRCSQFGCYLMPLDPRLALAEHFLGSFALRLAIALRRLFAHQETYRNSTVLGRETGPERHPELPRRTSVGSQHPYPPTRSLRQSGSHGGVKVSKVRILVEANPIRRIGEDPCFTTFRFVQRRQRRRH